MLWGVGLLATSLSQEIVNFQNICYLILSNTLSAEPVWYENPFGMIIRPARPRSLLGRNAISHAYDCPVEKS